MNKIHIHKINMLRILSPVVLISILIFQNLYFTGCLSVGDGQGKYFMIGNEDEVVESIREGLTAHSKKLTITCEAEHYTLEDVNATVKVWVSKALESTDNPVQGDYIRYQYGGYTIDSEYIRCSDDEDIYSYTITITPTYYTYVWEEEEVTTLSNALLESFGFDDDTTDYEKCVRIYDYICDNVSYDKVHAKNEYNHTRSTAYYALKYHSATCQGYAALLYRLLKMCGIDCRVVGGTAGIGGAEEGHVWNIICLDGKYYYADSTWDSYNNNRDCFLKSPADFPNHSLAEEYDNADFYDKYTISESSYINP